MGNRISARNKNMTRFTLCQRYPIYVTECLLNILGGAACFLVGAWLLNKWGHLTFEVFPRLMNEEQEAAYQEAMNTLYYSLLIVGIGSTGIGVCLLIGAVETCMMWSNGPCAIICPCGGYFRDKLRDELDAHPIVHESNTQDRESSDLSVLSMSFTSSAKESFPNEKLFQTKTPSTSRS